MEFPDNLYYTNDHEWISSLSGTAKVGISSYAIEQLGDIVHIDLPEVGTTFKAHDPFGTIESTKTVSDLYMPAACQVVELNQEVLKSPENLQRDPYRNGWLIKVKLEKDAKDLMTAEKYETYLKEET